MEQIDKQTFLNYVEFLTHPLFSIRDQKSHYFALYQGKYYYDAFIKIDEKESYIEIQLPMNFLGPVDVLLEGSKLHPEDFFEYINMTARNFDVHSVMNQLNDKAVTRAVLFKKALNFLDEKLPNIDVNKAVVEFDEFTTSLIDAIQKIQKDKVKESLRVIDGDKN